MGFRDMDLDDQVRAAIRRDRQLSTRSIDISVRNGIVYVKGSVSSQEHEHALEVVRAVDSVAAVVDQMQVNTVTR